MENNKNEKNGVIEHRKMMKKLNILGEEIDIILKRQNSNNLYNNIAKCNELLMKKIYR